MNVIVHVSLSFQKHPLPLPFMYSIAHGSTILFTAAEISLADYLMKLSRVLVGSLGTDRDRAVLYLDKMSTWRRWWH